LPNWPSSIQVTHYWLCQTRRSR
ncbi:transcription-repair coupling factor domain protein, partial [Vibrio parahaemolyticus V-223/04]